MLEARSLTASEQNLRSTSRRATLSDGLITLSEGEGSGKEKDHDEGQMPNHIELSFTLLSRFLVLSLDSRSEPSDSDRDTIWLDRSSIGVQ